MRYKVLTTTLLVLITVYNSFAGNDTKHVRKHDNKLKKAYAFFDEAYFEQRSQFGDPILESMRAKAQSSVNECDAQQRYVDFLSPNDLNRLPMGFKKTIGNTKIKIAIANAVFTSRYAELTVYAKVDIPQNNNDNGTNTANSVKSLYFGIAGLKLSKDGGIIGDARMVLLGDFAIKLGGNNASIILKGGMDMKTGAAVGKTYITIDCNGFKEFGLAAAVEFPRSLLEPINAQGDIIPTGQVRGEFTTVVSNWNDILVDVTLPPFQVKGVDGVGIQLSNAVIDLSDYRNSSNVVFPAGYQQKYLGANTQTLPLWRGVYAKNISITLPKSFAKRDSSSRVSFGAENLIIDNNGLTGIIYAENIIKLNEGSAGGWQFSLDSMRISFEANRLIRAGFGGRIGLPVNKTIDSDTQIQDSSAKKHKYLGYTGIFSSVGDYLCRVISNDSLSFDVWKAKVLLLPESYIELKGNKHTFKPSAMLSGSMTINAKTSTSGVERTSSLIDFKGVSFTNLNIKTEAPYITAQYFGFNGSVKLGILPVSIDSINLRSFGTNELGIGFNLKVNLQDNAFSGSSYLTLIGKYQPEQGLAKWKFDRIKVGAVSLNAEVGKMRLRGTLNFMDDDPKYGDGFNGNILLAVPLSGDTLKVSVAATFGNKGFRYWFVDGVVELPGEGIQLGALNINGFGGGAYYRMKKSNYNPTLTPTGLEYEPDSSAGLGLRASVLFNVASKKLDQGQATFEMAFNKGGGVRYMGFYGYARFQVHLDVSQLPGGGVAGFVKEQFKAIEDKIKLKSPSQMEALAQKKILNPSDGAKEETDGIIPSVFNAEMKAVVGINYDFNNKVLHANFEVYINAGSFLTGVGQGGRAGWAVLHIEPSKWYLHIGSPYDPVGVKIAVGPVTTQTGAYFMVGHDLPPFPPLPSALLALMSGKNLHYESNIGSGEKGDIQNGKGVAFGANVSVSTGDITFLILYANFSAGLGFDVMIKDYSDYYCQETMQRPGLDGWYAKGRVYAYLAGDAGVKIKLGFIKKRIKVIKGAAVAVMEARLPRPTWFGGLLGIRAELLGGLLKISLDLKLSFGGNCTLVRDAALNSAGGIDFDDFRVITSATPSNYSQDVSIYSRPVLTCLTRPNQQFTIPADEDNPEEIVRPLISTIQIAKGGQAVASAYKISQDGTKITVYPDNALSPQTDYVLTAKINYQRLVSGNWVNIIENGQPIVETTEVRFQTGTTPPFIADDNIGFMYPYKNQKFFYREESKFGRVLLNSDVTELFNSFKSWKARFINRNDNQIIATTDVTYSAATRMITYPLVLASTVATSTPELFQYGLVELPAYQEVSMSNFNRKTIDQAYIGVETASMEELSDIVPEVKVAPEFKRAPLSMIETPFLTASKPYRVEIFGSGYNANSLITDTSKPILTIDFNTSKHATLADKIEALQVIQPIVGRIESDVIDLQAKVANYEGFEVAEIVPTSASGNYPLIIGEAMLDNESYYQNQIKSLIGYELDKPFFKDFGIALARPVQEMGIIPYRAINTASFYLTAAQSSNYIAAVNDRFPFIYNLNHVFNMDFIDLRTKVINKYLSNMATPPSGPMYTWIRPVWFLPKVAVMTQEWKDYFNSPTYQQNIGNNSIGVSGIPLDMRKLVTNPFPFMPQGNYAAKFSLRLPISWSSTPGEFNYGVSTPGIFNYYNPIQ